MPHPTRRCDTCEFWDRFDQWANMPDRGNCHRNAPRPTTGEWEYEMLNHITTLSWQYSEDQEKFKGWEEAALVESSWPSTTGEDWCGEWQKREHESIERE
jgi:hypothetical protein